MITIAVTGHRPDKLGGYTADAVLKLNMFAEGCLRILCEKHDVKRIITGMALGWDTAIARACVALDLPFTAAIPFESQAGRWPQESQDIYYSLLWRAQERAIVCPGDYAAWKMQKRNEWMVDRADMIMALWNGSPGGTANCIAYAKSKDIFVKQVWQEWEGWR